MNSYRPASYSITDYTSELASYSNWLKSAIPTTKIIGPSFSELWRGNLSYFGSPYSLSTGDLITDFSMHDAEVNFCPKVPLLTPPQLAAGPSSATLGFADTLIQAAGSKPLIYTEFGPSNCYNGMLAVSESYGASFFILDSLFEFALKKMEAVCIAGTPRNTCMFLINI